MSKISSSYLTRVSIALGLLTLTCFVPFSSQFVLAAPATLTDGDCSVTYDDGSGGDANDGVVVTDIGVDCVVKFTRAGGTRTTWTKPLGVTSVRVLVVGGGGDTGLSGSAGKGAGGGGQVVEQMAYSFTSAAQNVYVLPYEGGSTSASYFDPATSGLVSVFAQPGGEGSTSDTTGGDTQGGSGGGASAKSTGRLNTGGTGVGTAGLGYAGGNSSNTASAQAGGGGGGGACSVGLAGAGTTGGDGGAGCSSDITGTTTYYGGGGGGGGGTPGSGQHGGGNGSSSATGNNGVDNTGGGAGAPTTGSSVAQGGDGVVIVRYTPGAAPDTTPPTLTLAATSATSITANIEFTLTGNEPIDCSTLSTSNSVDFDLLYISSITVTQSAANVCTISAISTATAGGPTRGSRLSEDTGFSVSDTAGNAQTNISSGAPATVQVTIPAPADTTPPTLTLSAVSSTSNTSAISFRVIGNEAIDCTTLTSSDFTATNAIITTIVQTNSTTCTVNATSTATQGGGTVVSSLAASGSFSMTDTASTPNAQTSLGGGTQSVSVSISASDTTPPTASWSTATSSSSLAASYTLTFSEAISGLSASAFSNAGTATGCVFTPSASTGTSVSVSVTCTGAGSLIAQLNSNSVQDGSNNQGPTNSSSSATTTLTCPPLVPAAIGESTSTGAVVPTATTSAPRSLQPMAAAPTSNTTNGGWAWVAGAAGTARTIDGVTWNFESQRRTSVPSGTQVTIQVSGGVGLQSAAQKMSDRGGANGMFMDNSIVGVSGAQLVTTDDGCTYGIFCPNRGQIRISFSPPATDPVLHFSGLGGGGYQSINQGRTTSWTEFQVLTPNARMSVLGQNNLQIVGSNRIEHIVKNPTFNCSNASNNYGATVAAGCGSFKFSGTYSEIVLQADFNSKNNGPAYFGSYLEDGFTMAVTIPMSQRLVIVTTTAPPTTTSTTVPPTTATPTTAAPTTTPPSTVPGACPINGGSNGGGSSNNGGGSNNSGSNSSSGGSSSGGSSSSGGVVDAYAVDGAKDLSVVTPDGPAKVNPFNGLVVPSEGFNESSLKILDPATKQWVDTYSDSSGTYAVVDGRVIVTPSNQVIGDISINTFIFKVADNTGSEVTGSHSVLIAAIDDLPEDLGPIVAEEATDAVVVKPGVNIRFIPSDIFESYSGEKFDSATFGLLTPDGVVDRLAVPQGTWLIKSGELRFIPAPGFMGYVRTDVSVRDSNGVLRTKSVSLYVGSLPTDNLPVTGSFQESLLTLAYFVMMIGVFVFLVDRGRRQHTF